jgi:hypothetical protein
MEVQIKSQSSSCERLTADKVDQRRFSLHPLWFQLAIFNKAPYSSLTPLEAYNRTNQLAHLSEFLVWGSPLTWHLTGLRLKKLYAEE